MAGKSSPGAAPLAASASRPEGPAPANAPKILRLKARADFLRLAKGAKAVSRGFVLQMLPAPAPENEKPLMPPGALRLGFTVTKKIGNAVARNRARRRLKEAARQAVPLYGREGHDYVLVARAEAISLDFAALTGDLIAALKKIHAAPRPKRT
jgi:ribonuclease P protein component